MIKIDVNIYHNKDYVRTMPKGYIYIYTTFAPISTRTQKLSIQEHCFWYMPFLVHRWTSTYIYIYIYIDFLMNYQFKVVQVCWTFYNVENVKTTEPNKQ